MPEHDIIVIGASAGGIEALRDLVRDFPADLQAAVFVVVHMSGQSPSVLPRLLSRWGPLPARHPEDEEPISPGNIYVAPPDYHLLVKPGYVQLSRGPRENGHRPAADPLFRTAARACGGGVIGVVLSGLLDDGTAGLAAIKARGGLAVVQDPEDALFSGMPLNAIENVTIDHVCPAANMGGLLARLALEPAPDHEAPTPAQMETEADMAELEPEATHNVDRPGVPSVFACPECGGSLFQIEEGNLIRYRCRVGHAFSPDTLLAEQDGALEEALWTALRALEESAALSAQMAERAHRRAAAHSASRLEERSRSAHQQAELIRRVLLNGQVSPNPEPTSESATLEPAEPIRPGRADLENTGESMPE